MYCFYRQTDLDHCKYKTLICFFSSAPSSFVVYILFCHWLVPLHEACAGTKQCFALARTKASSWHQTNRYRAWENQSVNEYNYFILLVRELWQWDKSARKKRPLNWSPAEEAPVNSTNDNTAFPLKSSCLSMYQSLKMYKSRHIIWPELNSYSSGGLVFVVSAIVLFSNHRQWYSGMSSLPNFIDHFNFQTQDSSLPQLRHHLVPVLFLQPLSHLRLPLLECPQTSPIHLRD